MHVPLIALALSLAVTPPCAGPVTTPTPAERAIERERSALASRPSAEGEARLAMALARRARETADPEYYAQAHDAVERALALAPDDVSALKARAWALLGQHEFARARELAMEINRRVPDDVETYGMLVDANVELGRLDEAERAAQWMLDLRPGLAPGLLRVAYLRELFGDLEGAAEVMSAALDQAGWDETEERAWILTHLSHLSLARGRVQEADELVARALDEFPCYHYALGQLALVRDAQGRRQEAAELQLERYRLAPHPENLYLAADALRAAGRRKEARAAWARFEADAGRESAGVDNANRELVLYLVDVARRPAEALALAEREAGRRQDSFTLDALAWAQLAAGERERALETSRRALAPGIVDARLRRHAAAIARANGLRDEARAHLALVRRE